MEEYAQEIPASALTILAGDHTAWSRVYAKTLRERTYEHQPQPLGGAKSIILGQGYSTIAWVPEAQGSWALPLLHERITSFETPLEKAATQLRQVYLQVTGPILFLGDAEYGCAPFLKQSSDIRCDQLLRLRPNRVLSNTRAKINPENMVLNLSSKIQIRGKTLKTNRYSVILNWDECE